MRWPRPGAGTAATPLALWAWGNGDLPIWMTFDAIEALRLPTWPLGGPKADISPVDWWMTRGGWVFFAELDRPHRSW
jgi:hypothetical protein